MKNDSDQLFSLSFNDYGKIISKSKNIIYCIYEKSILSTLDTAKLVFYTILPPSYEYEAEIIERKKDGYSQRRKCILEDINNNNASLVLKRFSKIGDYEIGFIIKLKNMSQQSYFTDSLFLPLKIR